MFRSIAILTMVAIAAGVAACGSDEASAGDACESVEIAPFKELSIVDQAVLEDPRSSNRSRGPWSFRYVIENMTPEGRDPGEFVHDWLVSWVTPRELNGFRLDRASEERDVRMQEAVLCPWMRRTPENQCDDLCTSCTGQKLDLARAPFRLIGIINRIDQRDEVATEPSGEGRLIFGLTAGAADDPTSTPLAMSIIFEFQLPESRTPKEWAETWHALGKHEAFDEAYRVDLEKVTNSFVTRGSNPKGINGSALAQLRTNESVLNWIWQLREFDLQPDGELRMGLVRNTPAEALNGSSTLIAWVRQNAELIAKKKHEVPTVMRSGSADQLLYSWTLPGVDETTRKAFASNTCNGCHSTENPSKDTAFHVSPFRKGTDRLSPFVYNPGKPDDLTARSRVMRRTLCGG